MRFPLIGEIPGVSDTRKGEDILRLTGRLSAWLGVFARPVNSQGLTGFFFSAPAIDNLCAPLEKAQGNVIDFF
jgi:hypothetical protein